MRIVAIALALLISANAAMAEIVTFSTMAVCGGIGWVWHKVTKVEKHNATQDKRIDALKDSLEETDSYVASKPWQADLEAYNASKAQEPVQKRSANDKWRDKVYPSINDLTIGRGN